MFFFKLKKLVFYWFAVFPEWARIYFLGHNLSYSQMSTLKKKRKNNTIYEN